MKNKTLREKIEGIISKLPTDSYSASVIVDQDKFIDKILNLISKEIKKNRPKEEISDPYDDPMYIAKDEGYNQALKEYDRAIADTLKI